MKYVDPPFELGETLSGKDDDGNLINGHWLGQVFEFPANRLGGGSFASGNKARRTGRSILAVALRNESGFSLLPKRLARLTRTAGYSLLESVDGYSDTLREKEVVIIDEFLPASGGVADDDIFWGILCGPVTVLTPTAGGDFNGDIAVGNQLVSSTASTTGTSDAGRISNATFNATTNTQAAINAALQQTFDAAVNLVGWALSSRTTGNTDSDILINAALKY